MTFPCSHLTHAGTRVASGNTDHSWCIGPDADAMSQLSSLGLVFIGRSLLAPSALDFAQLASSALL